MLYYLRSFNRVSKVPAESSYVARAGSWANYHLDSPVIQKLAIRAEKAMHLYSYHQIGRPRYKSYKRGLHSVEAKIEVSCIRSKDNVVEWKDLSFRIRPDMVNDVVQYGLDTKVKYVRSVRGLFGGNNGFLLN